MPAGLKFQSKIITLLLLVAVMLLSACSRDNPLNIPPKYIEEPAAFCIDDGPYPYFTLLQSVDISNTIDDLPDGYPFGYIDFPVELNAPFLINHTQIEPKAISDYDDIYNPETEISENVLIITEKFVNTEFVEQLYKYGTENNYEVESELALLQNYNPQVMSMTITVTYQSDAAKVSDEIDDELFVVTPALNYGKNSISLKAVASIKVPRTFIDCENPLNPDDLTSEEFKDEDRYKVISYSQSFPIEITRNELNNFESAELMANIMSSENDQLGKIISVNDDFLVIGSPNEDSDTKGITLVDNSFDQNDASQDSGAVYLFRKTEFNTWQFHSFIKSSNSEAGDLFGSAVSLYENTLVVSALGESSNASGIHLNSDAETINLKLNNTAKHSGAIYVFEFNEVLNAWSEKYYIKPEQNAVSDANYNKGFGSQLAIYKNKLLVSAPLEDSDNGNSTNSNQPDSGAVYIYNNNLNNRWRFAGVLKAVNPSANDKFGSAITLNENFFIVGAPFEDHSNRFITNNISEINFTDESPFENNARKDSGSVYVFKQSLVSDLFFLSTHIKSSNSDIDDYFGSSLAIDNGKLFVGAIGEDSSGKGLNRDMDKNDLVDSGSVYVFDYNQTSDIWVENAFIKANDSQVGATFGKYLVAENNNLFISAPLFDSVNDADVGKVYYYNFNDASVYQELLFDFMGQSKDMHLGSSLALYGRNLAIGASGFVKDESGVKESFSGKTYTFE